MQVSPQTLTERLDVLPAAVMGQLFAEVCARVQAQKPPALPHPLDADSIEEITEAFISSVRGIYGSNVWTLNQRVMRLRLVV